MPRDEVTGEIRDGALATIVGGRRAWTSASGLERRFGAGHMAALEASGWVVRWTADADGRPLDRPAVTLTPWAAERLGVEVDERAEPSGAEVPFWVAIGRGSPSVVQPRQEHTVAMGFPERVPDPGPSPIEYLIDLESGETTREPAEAMKLWGTPLEAPAARPPKVGKASVTDRRSTPKKGGRKAQGRSTPK